MKSRIYPFIVALVAISSFAIALVVGMIVYNTEGVRSKRALEGVYRKAFYDTLDSVNNLEIDLSKLIVSPSSNESLPLLTKVSSSSAQASASISTLPLSYNAVTKTSKYFNQVSDWCSSFAKAVTEKREVSQYARQAETLYACAKKINSRLQEMYEKSQNGMLFSLQEGVLMPENFSFDFEESGNNSIEYPTLIYDGPFSDAKKYEWSAIEGKAEITEENALEKVREIGFTDSKMLGVTEGKTTLYQISGLLGEDTAYFSISKKGGYIVNFDLSKRVGVATLSDKDAQTLAVSKAKVMGYEGLEPIWYNASDGVGYVNLAPKVNDITYYPDIVKVKIALDDGTLLGLEASGYCSSHKDRLLSPTISENTALSMVSEKLAVKNIALALIPYGENDEKLCYEINGEYEGLDYFVYIDAFDGKTRDVLRVVNNEQGSLIM